ncbi:MAG: DUF1028 domain-containing protein [Bacteroidetes bacterium]|nr:DUF1028 domain-containing protein [Rhodothermia bacterium]MCS7154806.1 DUF1028 domain-containing protein [Bacteroidota bacterium]MCX7907037.1 DUF1028 domain-containing protein [Bacteroidota bacterium]MDW8137599.1 DUF1028 domain-containing protein [Bacteroidota bacterium]MDW8285447.1 DUF1028 domain-containing protein [Bacteroidota bacterium]
MGSKALWAALFVGAACWGSADRVFWSERLVGTFSMVALDPETGDLGVVVQSKFPNVRPIVPWAEAGVGAVATQSYARLDYARRGLALMRQGATAEEALRICLREDPHPELRQVGMVDARGNAASWTGSACFDWAGSNAGGNVGAKGRLVVGRFFAAQGNILAGPEVVAAMVRAFEERRGPLAERLLAALVAGGQAGGDQRGEQSAALLVVRQGAGYDGLDNYIDISVYDHPSPIQELVRLYRLHQLYFSRSRPEDLIPITPDIARELQQIWRARGFYSGPINGRVDTLFQRILIDFMGWENYDMRIEEVQRVNLLRGDTLKIDRVVLEDIRRTFREGRWRPRTR